jgi:excisionase family DNA binding protein
MRLPIGTHGQTALLGIDDLAEWLDTSARHLRRLVAEKRIPYVKVGHFVRFDQGDIAAWIEQQKVGALSMPVDGQPPWVKHRSDTVGGKQLVAPTVSSRQAPLSPCSAPPWQSARSG